MVELDNRLKVFKDNSLYIDADKPCVIRVFDKMDIDLDIQAPPNTIINFFHLQLTDKKEWTVCVNGDLQKIGGNRELQIIA